MEPKGNTFHGCCTAPGTRFDARLDVLPAAVEFVIAALRAVGVPQERIARCELVLEELFRNSVLHGYGGNSMCAIWIGVEAVDQEGDIHLWMEDEAPAFDPLTADLPDGGALRPVEHQRVGGVGLQLIRELPKHAEYCRRAGRNCIHVIL